MQTKNKWFNKERKFLLISLFLLSIITIPLSTVAIIFLDLIFIKKFPLKTVFTIIKNNLFNLYFWNTFTIFSISILIHILIILLFIQIKGKSKYMPLYSEAKEMALGKAKWVVNEYEKPLSNKIKGRETELKNFEKVFSKDFSLPSFVTRTEILKNKLTYWGVSVRKAVHTITIGSTGSGKTQRIIYPSAIINSRLEFDKKPCMVFSDPKGEIYANLGPSLEKVGYDVLVLNLKNTQESSSWNPLANTYNFFIESLSYREKNFKVESIFSKFLFEDFLEKNACYLHKKKSCTSCAKILDEQPNYQQISSNTPNNNKYEVAITFKEVKFYIIEGFWTLDEILAEDIVKGKILNLKTLAFDEINDLAATLLNPGEDSKNKQWYDGAQGIFKGVIFAMLEMLEEGNDFINQKTFNIITVATHLSDKDKLSQFFNKWKVGRETNQSVIAANKVLTSSSQSIGNFFSIVSTALALFEGEGLRNLLCKNDINLFDFVKKEKPKAIFMVVPDDKKDKHPLVSLFISQFYKANVYKANQNLNVKGVDELDRDVIFYLDEFGNFPQIPNFDTILTVSRGRRMFFNLVVQSFSQFDKVYGKEVSEIIIGNCLLTVYLKSASASTHKQISEMCGQTTKQVRSSSPSINPKTGSKSYSYHLNGQPLIQPSDIKLIFPPDKVEENKFAIVMYQDSNPSLITYEYFYKMKSILGLSELEASTNVTKSIDFEKDYYINLFELNINPKKKEQESIDKQKFSFVEKEFEDTFDNNLDDKNEKEIDQLLELKLQEKKIRNDLFVLQSKSEDRLSTDEKNEIKQLQKKLLKILKQI